MTEEMEEARLERTDHLRLHGGYRAVTWRLHDRGDRGGEAREDGPPAVTWRLHGGYMAVT